MSITKATAKSLTLPVLTFCNLNMYTYSKLKRQYPEVLIFFSEFYENIADQQNMVINDTLIRAMKEIPLTEFIPNTAATVDEVFVECKDSHMFPMNCKEHVIQTMTDRGLCFSFNTGQGSINSLNRSSEGMLYQVSLTLDVNPDEYFGISNGGEGFLVVIHNQNEFPNANTKSFGIGPGQEVYVALQKHVTNILPRPYSSQNCIGEDQDTDNDDIDLWLGYSQEECQYRCLLDYFSTDYCTSVFTPNDVETKPPCSLYDLFTEEYIKILDLYNEGLQCGCLPECSYTGYQQRISRSTFPSELVSAYAEAQGWPIINKTEIERRYTQLHVYFDDMQYTISQQNPSMTIVQLVSNVGGQLGLWIGASVISIIEVFDFIAVTAVKQMKMSDTKIEATKRNNFNLRL